MSRRTVLAAVLLAATATATSVSPAGAAEDRTSPVVQRAEVVESTVVLYRHDASRITVEVVVTDDEAVEAVFAGLYQGDSAEQALDGITVERFARIRGTNTWRGHTWVDRAYPTGRYTLAVFAFDRNGNLADRDHLDTVHLKRNTTMPAFGAAPEPVRKGAPIEVSGRLERLSAREGYVGYAGRTVTVQFRPTGGSWTARGTATTGADGTWRRRFAATTDGTWRASFAGTTHHHAQTSSADFVEVR